MMQILSIFTGTIQEVKHQERMVSTGIYKNKVQGKHAVKYLGLEGDQQADLKVHGGLEKAVYAYPMEHYSFWKEERPDLSFEAGIFGENLSISGLEEESVCIGDTFKIGTTELVVTGPRMPCYKLGIKMRDSKFVSEFLKANKTGFYFKVQQEGFIEAGDEIERLGQDSHQLSIPEVVRLYSSEKDNQTLLRKAVNTPALPEGWRTFFEKRLID